MKYPSGLLPDLDLGFHAFMALMQPCYFPKEFSPLGFMATTQIRLLMLCKQYLLKASFPQFISLSKELLMQ